MNAKRVLSLLNILLKMNSYSIHQVQPNGTHKLSIPGAVAYLSTLIIYLAALYIHHTKRDYFEVYEMLSNFYYEAVYVHLYTGCVAAILIPLSFIGQTQFNRNMAVLAEKGWLRSRNPQSPVDPMEIFVYYKLYLNLIVYFGLTAYNIIMLDWNDFAWYKLMLYMGLYLPHFSIANILQFFCVNALLLRSMAGRIAEEMEVVHTSIEWQTRSYSSNSATRSAAVSQGGIGSGKSGLSSVIRQMWDQLHGRTTSPNSKQERMPVIEIVESRETIQLNLVGTLRSFMRLQRMAITLNSLFQKQFLVLGFLHVFVLYTAFHSFLKIEQVWPEFVPPKDITSIRVNFQLFVILIANDFLCLFVVGSFYRNTVSVASIVAGKSSLYQPIYPSFKFIFRS